MDNARETATAEEAPIGKQRSAAARSVGGGVKARKQAAADVRPGAKKPAPAQRPKAARSKPAAGGRAQSRSQPAERGRTHPEAPRRKPTRRNQPKPPPAQQQATSPPGPAARKPDGGPVEPAAAATATPETPPPVHGQAARLRGLAERANSGDEAALADLRSMLDARPEIWGHCGDLGRLAEEQWLDALCIDALGRESIRRHVHKFKVQLAGPQPTDLEWLIAQEVAACLLAKKHAEVAAAAPGGSVQLAALRTRRLDAAQKAYLRSVRMLMMLRLGCRQQPP